MTRKNFFLLGLAVIIGASVWLLYAYRGIKSTQDALVEQAELTRARRPASIPVTVTPPASANKVLSSTKIRLQQEALNLQQQLIEATNQLETQRQSLESLRARQIEESQAPTPDTYSTALNSSAQELQSFVAELNSYDQMAEEINRRADEILYFQNSQAQVARSQIDDNIRDQERLIQQTQNDLAYWHENFNDLTVQQNKLTELTDLLSRQQQQLALMRDEKLLLSSQALSNPQSIQEDRNQALSVLSDNRLELQEEIAITQAQIRRLQENIYQSTTSQHSLRQQIRQNQRAYEQQQQRLKKIEASLIEKNRELNALE